MCMKGGGGRSKQTITKHRPTAILFIIIAFKCSWHTAMMRERTFTSGIIYNHLLWSRKRCTNRNDKPKTNIRAYSILWRWLCAMQWQWPMWLFSMMVLHDMAKENLHNFINAIIYYLFKTLLSIIIIPEFSIYFEALLLFMKSGLCWKNEEFCSIFRGTMFR